MCQRRGVLWRRSAILTLGGLKQEAHEFVASLGYKKRPLLNKKQINIISKFLFTDVIPHLFSRHRGKFLTFTDIDGFTFLKASSKCLWLTLSSPVEEAHKHTPQYSPLTWKTEMGDPIAPIQAHLHMPLAQPCLNENLSIHLGKQDCWEALCVLGILGWKRNNWGQAVQAAHTVKNGHGGLR